MVDWSGGYSLSKGTVRKNQPDNDNGLWVPTKGGVVKALTESEYADYGYTGSITKDEAKEIFKSAVIEFIPGGSTVLSVWDAVKD